MLKLADNWTVYPTTEAATAVASTLNAQDDDWTYVVIPNPVEGKTSAIIKIYDEEGFFVGNFGG